MYEILRLNIEEMSSIRFRLKSRWGGTMGPIEVKKFYQEDSGASAVEYSILLCCIAIAIISAVAIFGSSVNVLFHCCPAR
jgi:Flp pilus assembly pilin Flp